MSDLIFHTHPRSRGRMICWMLEETGADYKTVVVDQGDMERVLDTLERAVTTHAWIADEQFSAADIYLGGQLGFGLQFGTIDKRPAFEDYVRRTTDREAWRRAAQIDDALLPTRA